MKLKLCFDDIIYQLQSQGGVSTYWKEITSRITVSEAFEITRTTGNKFTKYLPVYQKSHIFHSSYYRISANKNAINIVTIYDFIYELGYIHSFNSFLNIWQMKSAIHAADAIVCISESTKKDLLVLYPQLKNHPHIYVVGLGATFKIDEVLNLQPPLKVLEVSRTMNKRYILFIGKRVKYKNFKAAISGFFESSLPKLGFSMICVGSKFSEEENTLFSNLGLQDRIIAFENLANKELNYLYQNAYALVYPSLYEGFGLPPLDAMNCGCPVIASNISSMPEVVGDAGILVDPENIGAISCALEKLLDYEIRNNYIDKGFTRAKLFNWDEAAKKHIEIYNKLASSL
jgi:mannosyltransferase